MKTIVFGLVAVLVLNTYGLAYPEEPRQNANPSPATNTQLAESVKHQVQKRGVGEKSRVKVKLRDKDEVKGYISQIDGDSFQVTEKKSGQVKTIAYDKVEKVSGAGLSKGAKIWIVAGITAGVVVAACLISLAASGE